MATAIEKSRAARQLARRAPNVRLPTSMEFLIFEDKSGSYYCTIVAGDGTTLARSDAFASYDDAERAAQHVRDRAASAPFEDRAVGAGLVDLSPRGERQAARLRFRAPPPRNPVTNEPNSLEVE